jgi:L-alanine-DL-glutamate epimerase-like enolase superfamily enzyme
MREPSSIAAVVASRVHDRPWRSILVELWTRDGASGIGRVPDSAGMLERIWRLGSESVGMSVADASRRWTRAVPEGGWLSDLDEWRALGVLETAALDLQARLRGLPLWLWLGGGWRWAVSVVIRQPPHFVDADPLGISDAAVTGLGLDIRADGGAPARFVSRPLSSWSEARNAILAGTVRALVVDPLAAGGPAGVARLDAIARAFRLELAIAAVEPSLFDQTLAIHLAVASRMATLPVQLPSLSETDLDFYTRYSDFRSPGALIARPGAPGLGFELRPDVVERHTVERLATGVVPERRR